MNKTPMTDDKGLQQLIAALAIEVPRTTYALMALMTMLHAKGALTDGDMERFAEHMQEYDEAGK